MNRPSMTRSATIELVAAVSVITGLPSRRSLALVRIM